MFRNQRLSVRRSYEFFSLLFHQVPSVPQGASSLSEGLWITSHFPAVELGHPILNWILGIIGWSGMLRIDREIAGTTMICRSNRIRIVIM